MPEKQVPLLSAMPPSRAQVVVAAAVAALLSVVFAASFPYRAMQLPEIDAFIPVVDTSLLLSDVITATLLLAQFSVQRSRALLALATGYLFAGLIIIPHALTFPGAFSANGLLGAGVNTTIWLYYFWHLGLPLAVIVYALLKSRDPSMSVTGSVTNAIYMSVAVAALAAVALTMLTTWGHDLLPSMMSDSINWSSARLFVVAVILLSLILTAMALLLRGRPSILDVWLLITLWAWLVELVLVMLTSARFSLFWYAGRLYGLLSGVFVLLMLLSETTKLYARLATSVLARHQERESRILTMNSATASIAHEVNQPLAAVVNNGNAALRFLSLIPPNLDETRAAVKRIVSDGHRAASVIQSIRSLFRNVTSEVRPVDVNQIVSDALALVTAELREHRVTVQADLDDTLPRVVGDRVPLQQVIVNLVTNAMEAMSAANSQSRVLRVTSARHDADHVRISMEDTGPGIDPQHIERIFEPFFTTKPTGMGMGLALCRSIVESYQGQLSVTTRHQSGAVFIIVLPVSTGAVG